MEHLFQKDKTYKRETEAVEMSENVTFATRISVLQPGPTKHALFFQYSESVKKKVKNYKVGTSHQNHLIKLGVCEAFGC